LDKSWCRVPTGLYKGQLQECIDCYQSFGSSCVTETKCFQPNGCFYELNKDMERDDIMVAAFIPDHFAPPLTFTITKLMGADYNATEMCPESKPDTSSFNDVFVKSSSVNVDVLVTFTQVEKVIKNTAVQLEFSNINYAELEKDATSKAQFIEAVKEGVVQSVDTDIDADDVTVEISDDMVVEISVTPGGDDSAYEIGKALNTSSTLHTNVLREIDEGVTNQAQIKTTASSSITVKTDDVDIPIEEAPPPTPTPTPRPTPRPTPTPAALSPRVKGTADLARPFAQPPMILIMLITWRVFLRWTSGRLY